MKLKKALSLTLALVMSLAMAVPAFAAPVTLDAPDSTGIIEISDATKAGTITFDGSNGSTYTDDLYEVPVGVKVSEPYGHAGMYVFITRIDQKADGTFSMNNDADAPEYEDSATFGPGTEGYWHISFGFLDFENIVIHVGGSAPATEPEKPTEPTTPTQPEQPAKSEAAMPTNDQFYVDGELAVPAAYKIDGSNYFKIRDVAALLNGTAAQFSVGYDNDTRSVTLTTGEGYEKEDSDLAGIPAGEEEAVSSNNAIYINGEEVELTVYKIGGNNYFKLRDLGKSLGFNVGYTAGYGAFIETDKPYAE